LLIVFTAAALFFPVAFWAFWLTRHQRRLVDDLSSEGIKLLEAGASDASCPLILEVAVGGRRCVVQATVRGTTPLWRLSVPRINGAATGPLRALYVRSAWAPRSAHVAGLKHQKVHGRYRYYDNLGAPSEPNPADASPKTGEDSDMSLRHATCARFCAATERLVNYKEAITELALLPDRMELEVRREQLSAAELSRWIWVLAALTSRVDDETEVQGSLFPLVRGAGSSFSGSSVGIAGA